MRKRASRPLETSPVLTVEAVGQSEAFMDFKEQLARVAPVERPVLLLGERGTGKELAATRLHFLSRRWEGPFVSLNCAALSPSLIEAELFGHEKGAFTGAGEHRVGRFETADGGTLFLDEIGSIPSVVQEKILRVVEYGVFERVGSSRPISVDARIIGATNANLKKLVQAGQFKRDLLDRLSFEALFLPPLRMRSGDIPLLAAHFARRMAVELGFEAPPRFSKTVMNLLERHPWPGNIRELKNVVERAVYRCADGRIEDVDFEPLRSPYAPLETEAAAPVDSPSGSSDNSERYAHRHPIVKGCSGATGKRHARCRPRKNPVPSEKGGGPAGPHVRPVQGVEKKTRRPAASWSAHLNADLSAGRGFGFHHTLVAAGAVNGGDVFIVHV
jgi:psp operon transcriptional activator